MSNISLSFLRFLFQLSLIPRLSLSDLIHLHFLYLFYLPYPYLLPPLSPDSGDLRRENMNGRQIQTCTAAGSLLFQSFNFEAGDGPAPSSPTFPCSSLLSAR